MSKKTKAEERAAKAAAALAERKRKERRRNTITIVSVVAAIALIVGIGFVINKARDDDPSGAADERSTEYEVALGDPDAPHSIVIYEDFLCPICREFEAASRDKLAEAAEAGDVYVSYRPFNLFSDDADPRKAYSVAAAAAFAVVQEESGDEVAKEFHDLLYENQPPENPPPSPETDWFVDLAVRAGATEDDVREGIESGAGEDWVEAATDEADEAGVNSTPTILLDGEEYQQGRTFQELADNLVAAVQ
jgi:protein-disulfide isomerase